MGGARRADDPVETVTTAADHPTAREPRADLLLEHRRARLARQDLAPEPPQRSSSARASNGETARLVKDNPSMATPRPACPVVAVERLDQHAHLLAGWTTSIGPVGPAGRATCRRQEAS